MQRYFIEVEIPFYDGDPEDCESAIQAGADTISKRLEEAGVTFAIEARSADEPVLAQHRR